MSAEVNQCCKAQLDPKNTRGKHTQTVTHRFDCRHLYKNYQEKRALYAQRCRRKAPQMGPVEKVGDLIEETDEADLVPMHAAADARER